jgi:hypothetical protein
MVKGDSTMALDMQHISLRLAMPEDELVKRSVLSFITHEIRLAEWDISDIKDRYAVASPSEMGDKIRLHEIHSHPAWEDLIHWESLEEYVRKLRSLEEEIVRAA